MLAAPVLTGCVAYAMADTFYPVAVVRQMLSPAFRFDDPRKQQHGDRTREQ
jgi:hypothetical protein